ncbi:MAG: ATP-binding protein [Bacteroidia bacterium]
MESHPVSSGSDQRLKEILEMIAAMASLDFSRRLDIRMDPKDPLEAVAYGVNMLSEELSNNVTERKRLIDINRRLEEFAYTTSHDLKSPLHAVQGLVTILKTELGDSIQGNAEITKLLELIDSSVNKMRLMIDGILEYSRLNNDESPAVWIDSKKEVSDLIQMHLSDKVSITVDSDLPGIRYNKVAFIQIMDNLIANSIKYCNKDSCRIRIRHTSNPAFHTFSVSDNGPGIHPDLSSRIFELFVSIPQHVGGESSGIGLATVKKLVERAGGQIRFESEPGKGATFFLTIPVKDGL